MAAEISASLAEVISVLDPSKIPDKLHCPHCDGFLLNGYKLSCCDQSICESCYPKVSDRCLICDHQPFTQELCKPNIGLRKTAKAFLKTQEKKLADEREKSQAAVPTTNIPPTAVQQDEGGSQDAATASLASGEDRTQEGTPVASSQVPAADDPQPSIETVNDLVQLDAGIAIRDGERVAVIDQKNAATPMPAETSGNELSPKDDKLGQLAMTGDGSLNNNSNGMGADMNMNGFPNMFNMNAGVSMMDPGQMMQFMTANGMNNFNPMMGMPNMGMNQMPQGMFGGFGGPGMGVNGMNGMNMGMNFDPNAGMYGAGWNGQTNNMWNGPQSNNPNAFSNGIGGDFGSNSGYGYNMSQSANFHQQQHPHGDFGYYGRGPGRGRGRLRGGFNRNRSGFNNISQANQPHFQNAHEQQQYEIQNIQAQMLNDPSGQQTTNGQNADTSLNKSSQVDSFDDDEFAPGGQEEVQEALGADYHKSQIDESKEHDQPTDAKVLASIEVPEQAEAQADVNDGTPLVDGQQDLVKSAPVQSPPTYEETVDVPKESPKRSISQEEPKASMPPPSAPLGPSSQHRDPDDYGFRARGHGKFTSRSRGSLSGLNGGPISPLRAPPQPPTTSPPDTKGVGVIGAPTGPRAMREPPSRASRPASGSLSNTGGFKIMGRASMASQDREVRAPNRSRSNTPINGEGIPASEPRSASRQQSRHSGRDSSRYDVDTHDDYDRDYDRDRKRSRKSRKHETDDYEMQDGDEQRSRSRTPSDRKSSHRSRRDKDHRSSSHKRSSRSRRERHETNGDKSQELDDYGLPVQSSREAVEAESRSGHRGHRSSKSSRHDDRDRDREERHRDRKRSRHDRDRDRDDGSDDEEASRHRSRRHKREHRDDSAANGNGTTGRSHRSSEAATPVESEKDPHTLEREARNRERMAKELQRREKAMRDDQGGGAEKRRDGGRISGSRRVSYKYEEDLQSAMVETERENTRWR